MLNYALMVICLVIVIIFALTTQTLRATGGYVKVIQGGDDNWKEFTQIRKVSTDSSVYPGRFLASGGETDGELRHAAAGDGDIGSVELCIKRVGAKDQDVDTAIAAGEYVLTLRCVPGGGSSRFLVACILADGTNEKAGTLLELEADGMLERYTYAGSAAIYDAVARLYADSDDVATTDRVILAWV